MTPTLRFCLTAFAACILICSASAKSYQLTVASATVDRADQLVAFPLPTDLTKPVVLLDHAGRARPLQIDADGTACFIVTAQKAGETLRFTLRSGAPAAAPGVTVSPDHGDLLITAAGRPAFVFRMDPNAVPRPDIPPELKRAGYLHPVWSPSGKLVTDDYPSNHAHHHGIWSPWACTTFQGRKPDFWNMFTKTGAEQFVALDRTWTGQVEGGLEARLRMVDLSAPTPVVALNETWQVTAYAVVGADRPVTMFDLVITQSCATPDPLILRKYHYGGLGFRGAAGWNGSGNEVVHFLTSEGITDRYKGDGTRARWCYIGGLVGGGETGAAILGHPSNFRAPQPMRLNPSMPFFCFAPSQLGDWSIQPGKPYVARYRFVVFDGAPDRAQIDACWNGYASPASVKIEPLSP